MWGGRFEEKTSPIVERYGQSVSYDKRLWPQVRRPRLRRLEIDQSLGPLRLVASRASDASWLRRLR